jgi:mannose-6-phosphate isomerase-like protein (cupin superfamily)
MTLEDVKAAVERVTGWRRPSAEQLAKLLQSRRIATFRFRDDGFIPNNPWFPVTVYRRAVKLSRSLDPAAVWEALFESNGWGDTWRDGIYDYLHYHSRIHEVLGIARGSAIVRLGGNKGRSVKLKAGDADSCGHGPSMSFCQQDVHGRWRLSSQRNL